MSTYTQGRARIATETAATVVAAGKREICECYADGEVQDREDEENARRIVALWNACDGVTTERLEAGGVRAAMNFAAEAVDARKAADLRCAAIERALRNLLGVLDHTTGRNCAVDEVQRAIREARAELAKGKS